MNPLTAASAAGTGPDRSLPVKLRYVLGFMAISVLFFVGGVAADLYGRSQPHAIDFYISPSKMPPMLTMPKMRNGDVPINLSEDGFVRITVKDRDTLRLAIDDLIEKVDYFSTLLGELTRRCDATTATGIAPSASPIALEGGFSDAS